MSQSAKVRSIDAVGTFSAALKNFEEEASGALTSLDMEVRRVLEWIHQDRKEFWKREVRRRQDKMAEARGDLERCLTYRATDERPSCHEEKIALEKAKRRLRVAEEKVLVVRHWARVLDHEVHEFKGIMNQLSHWLQVDHPQALATLERMMAALSAYVGLESTVQSDAGNEPMSRPAEPADASAGKPGPDEAEEDESAEASVASGRPEDRPRSINGDEEDSE
jgi:exonuclease VII large subunit